MSFLVILVTVETHQSSRFVFATFVSGTGWGSNGVAFIVGLVNANWAFACKCCVVVFPNTFS